MMNSKHIDLNALKCNVHRTESVHDTNFPKPILHRPLLILDLDETLIYSTKELPNTGSFFQVGSWFVKERPGMHEFLDRISPYYDLAIWTAASADYAKAITDLLRANHSSQLLFKFVWSRERCVSGYDPDQMDELFIKDLKKVKRNHFPLERVLVVDDRREALRRHRGNLIRIKQYQGSSEDRELEKLGEYLVEIKDSRNFRSLDKGRWR